MPVNESTKSTKNESTKARASPVKRSVKRLAAKKARIADIINSKFFPGSREGMKPSYAITPFGQKISRVNLVATVVDKFLSDEENYASLTIDDGTGAIRAKAFGNGARLFDTIEMGDLVLVIGKLKEYQAEVYVNAEIARKVDINYESLSKLEVLDQLVEQKRIIEEMKSLSEQMSRQELEAYAKDKFGIDRKMLETMLERKEVEVDYKPKILEVIESLDEGNGVDIGKLFELSDLPEHIIERAVDELLASGYIFEPMPGRFSKVKG